MRPQTAVAAVSGIGSRVEVAYLILSVTPWGTPTLTVADRTLCRLIFLSTPYSTTVPNQPVLGEEEEGGGESQDGKQNNAGQAPSGQEADRWRD